MEEVLDFPSLKQTGQQLKLFILVEGVRETGAILGFWPTQSPSCEISFAFSKIKFHFPKSSLAYQKSGDQMAQPYGLPSPHPLELSPPSLFLQGYIRPVFSSTCPLVHVEAACWVPSTPNNKTFPFVWCVLWWPFRGWKGSSQ